MTDVLATLQRELAGRYAVERELGRGGMATVYLARDLRHDRLVAIKVLDPDLGAVLGADRFLSEIRVTANLQHPHLLPLFDSGAAGGLLYYVMPFVDGETLRERIEREKQLPVDEAIAIARGIAQALAYAHARGVIHRDLKPENVLLQSDQPVVADFGIALAVRAAGGARLTQTGLSLGTPQYMSPEQAAGDRQIDARSDLFSLGAVLYEMLTGEPPHTGPTVQAVIAKLLTETPRPMHVTRPGVPAHLERLVASALAKLPADRITSADRFVDGLRSTGPDEAASRTADPTRAHSRDRTTLLPWSIAVAALAALVIALFIPRTGTGPRDDARSIHAELDIDLAEVFGSPVLSPDGRHVVWATMIEDRGVLKLLDLSTGERRTVEGSEYSRMPFFSPDGRWIAAFNGTRLYRFQVSGGPLEPVMDIKPDAFVSGTWTTRGEIIIRQGGASFVRVPETGGAGVDVAAPGDSASRCIWPLATPNGRFVLCNVGGPGGVEDDYLWIVDLSRGTGTNTLMPIREPAAIVDGHLIFRQGLATEIMAVRLDEIQGKLIGKPFKIAGSAVGISVSAAGTALIAESDAHRRIVLRAGDSTRTLWMPPWPVKSPRLSPDGRRIAVVRAEPGLREAWVYDLSSTAATRVAATADGVEWTADGREITYPVPVVGTMQPTREVRRRAVDLSSPERTLFRDDSLSFRSAQLASDGRSLVFHDARRSRLYVVDIAVAAATPRVLTVGERYPDQPQFSPNGRWIAYRSIEAIDAAIVVRASDGSGGPVTISDSEAIEPRWSRDGRALYYRSANEFIRASLVFDPVPRVVERRRVLHAALPVEFDASYDVATDGQRLVVAEPRTHGRVRLIVNWRQELAARAH